MANNPETMLECRMLLPRKHGFNFNRKPLTAQGTNVSSKHALVQVHESTQQNAREVRPLTDKLVQVPCKTSLDMRKWANVLECVYNVSTNPQWNTNVLCY